MTGPFKDNDANDLMQQYLDESGQFARQPFVAKEASHATITAAEAGIVLPVEEEASEDQSPDEQNGTIVDDFLDRARRGASTATDRVTRAQDWIAAQPTPGGLAPLLFALAIFSLAIVPVSPQGYTRLQLLFYTVLGRTNLRGRRSPTNGSGGQSWTDQPPAGVPQSYQAPARPTNNAQLSAQQYSPPVDFANLDAGF